MHVRVCMYVRVCMDLISNFFFLFLQVLKKALAQKKAAIHALSTQVPTCNSVIREHILWYPGTYM